MQKFFTDIDFNNNFANNMVLGGMSSPELSNLTLKAGYLVYNTTVGDIYFSDGANVVRIGTKLSLSDLKSPTENLDLANVRIINGIDPLDHTDMATKGYVDSVAMGSISVTFKAFKTFSFVDYGNIVSNTVDDTLYFVAGDNINFEVDNVTKRVEISYDIANSKVTFDGSTFISSDLNYKENFDLVDHIMERIIPNRPSDMANTDIVLNTVSYSAKIPDGLSSPLWYVSGGNINDVVSNVVYTPNIVISDNFYSGVVDYPKTYGFLKIQRSNVDVSNISTVVGTNSNFTTAQISGNIRLNSISSGSNVWRNANTISNVNLLQQGVHNFTFDSTVSGKSRNLKVFYDNNPNPPSHVSEPIVSITHSVYKYLSNVSYLTLGSNIDVSFSLSSGIFDKTYHPNAVVEIYSSGNSFDTSNVNPSFVPLYYDSYADNKIITFNKANGTCLSNNALVYVKANRPNGLSNIKAVYIGKGINTYGNIATDTEEYFLCESYRLISGTDNVWNPSSSFSTSNVGIDAQVRNGRLVYPVASDYGGSYTPTGEKRFERFIHTNIPINSGVLYFEGINPQLDISPYGTGSLNVVISINSHYFDIGKTYSTSPSGNSMVNAFGSKLSANATHVNFSFGTYSTSLQDEKYKLYVCLRDNSKSIYTIKHYNV